MGSLLRDGIPEDLLLARNLVKLVNLTSLAGSLPGNFAKFSGKLIVIL